MKTTIVILGLCIASAWSQGQQGVCPPPFRQGCEQGMKSCSVFDPNDGCTYEICIPKSTQIMGVDGKECPARCPVICNYDEQAPEVQCPGKINENGCPKKDFCVPLELVSQDQQGCPEKPPKPNAP